jgi:hypothetical protein
MTEKTNKLLAIKYAFYATIVFFLIANPETYSATQRFFGSFVTILSNGVITPYGFLLHATLFFGTMAALLMIR